MSVENLVKVLKEILKLQQIYEGAIKEISTKLEVLDDEFNIKYSHNPIHHMESRLKQAHSILNKLQRKEFDISIASAKEHLTDIASIMIICYYMEDIYAIADLLTKQG